MSEESHVSRRGFMKQGVVASGALTAFTVLPARDARAAKEIKVGVVGCGGRGRGAMKNALNAYEGIKVVALADILQEKIDAAKQELEKREIPTKDIKTFLGFKSYKDLLEVDMDYVILATPPCYRPESLEAAVAAKRHVFMEKPAAVDAPGIRRIIEAGEKAKELGLSIVAGTQRRHQKEYVECIERLRDGVIGEIVNLQVFWCGGPIGFGDQKPGMTEVEWQIRSWYHFGWLSGDHILEQHVHNIDVANWIMGMHPVTAYGVGSRGWQERGNIWDHHAVHYEYPNGVNMLSMCSQYPRENHRVEERVQGITGSSDCKHWIKNRAGKVLWKWDETESEPYVQEHVDLVASILEGTPINEARNVGESTMTAMMGRMATYSGKEMHWDEAYNSNETYPVTYDFGEIKEREVPVPGGKKYTGEEGWKPG